MVSIYIAHKYCLMSSNIIVDVKLKPHMESNILLAGSLIRLELF